ncbi:hypothetical protein HIM_05714 [Hirsutella minnesotensis 3608]|uniref:Phosphoribosylaminoimidazole-succinocarboxamide synthase n=1 Tax=Hirsutella minnesotensis 3608 TaxID=1043627 RepID=A0A0F7ZP34_9HYPO|nr:hypothetical protein HIM_05714 [Hirsutella minnesotensis 3608]
MGPMKDELAMIAGKITPGIDNTPYIHNALDALTRDRASSSGSPIPPGGLSGHADDYQAFHEVSGEVFTSPSLTQSEYGHNGAGHVQTTLRYPDLGIALPLGPDAAPRGPDPSQAPAENGPRRTSNQWMTVDRDALQTIDPRGRTYPPLTYKPRILRLLSMCSLVLLCLLMIAALVFSNTFSDHNAGLTPYPGTIYSGQYFIFRILPQIVAAVILVFAQNILTASLRILPFTIMADEDPRERYLALFQSLYPRSFMFPQLVGPWQVVVFDLATWLTIFTIPLQSAAFTCIFVRDAWIWAPSQGVAWVLVGLYAFLAVSTIVLMLFWFKRWTGVRWDMRSIADLIPLLSRTNTMHSYARRAGLEPPSDLKAELRDRWFDRLGYWQTNDVSTGGVWHAIGTSAARSDHRIEPDGAEQVKNGNYDPSIGSRDMSNFAAASSSYLPWCLHDRPLIGFTIVTGILLIALIIVSFLPQTRLDAGFDPRLAARPNQAAFSAANFLYSFIPALLGMVLFLLFQSLDLALRILQPWGELARVDGASARKSILADYAACLPVQSTWRALRNGHWRVAATSLMAVLFIFIPVLAGGLFMALTTPEEAVRMFPSMPVLGALLAFLFLYVGSLSLLLPRRRQFQLPHPVTSVAAIVSLCAADELIQDPAFRAVQSHHDLAARLGAGGDDGANESTWCLGLVSGKDEHQLSVRRLTQFTGKRMRLTSSAVV